MRILVIDVGGTNLKISGSTVRKPVKVPSGPGMSAAGMIEVDRTKGSTALRDMVQRCREEAAKGRQIVIFPEGTRRPPGAEPAYQPGIALLYKGLGLDPHRELPGPQNRPMPLADYSIKPINELF